MHKLLREALSKRVDGDTAKALHAWSKQYWSEGPVKTIGSARGLLTISTSCRRRLHRRPVDFAEVGTSRRPMQHAVFALFLLPGAHALLEIQIEGSHGWAQNLPPAASTTAGPASVGEPLTCYHLSPKPSCSSASMPRSGSGIAMEIRRRVSGAGLRGALLGPGGLAVVRRQPVLRPAPVQHAIHQLAP